ncbi:MAG TPA: bis-aminopropyl spermidine synthase family protein [Herpetosiphonaceae bacterium]|nr:bis-aminopropyl spermidine synthase family protein [Herpetosiphonaceae bacterium]
MAELIDSVRPPSLRIFDQIPMRPRDHVRQAKLIAPYLAGQTVEFMGDSDCTSLLLGLLSRCGLPLPSRMLVLDFDARLLKLTVEVAESYGFGHALEARLYNAFDVIPSDLVRQFDWFYTNPPYGSHNLGESARLFINRACDLVRPDGQGCIILPHDRQRQWTQQAMWETQLFLTKHAWIVNDKVRELHRYKLDDDRSLASSLMMVEHVGGVDHPMPYTGRRVACDEIPLFYGRGVQPPYPRYVRCDATFDEDWITSEVYDA